MQFVTSIPHAPFQTLTRTHAGAVLRPPLSLIHPTRTKKKFQYSSPLSIYRHLHGFTQFIFNRSKNDRYCTAHLEPLKISLDWGGIYRAKLGNATRQEEDSDGRDLSALIMGGLFPTALFLTRKGRTKSSFDRRQIREKACSPSHHLTPCAIEPFGTDYDADTWSNRPPNPFHFLFIVLSDRLLSLSGSTTSTQHFWSVSTIIHRIILLCKRFRRINLA